MNQGLPKLVYANDSIVVVVKLFKHLSETIFLLWSQYLWNYISIDNSLETVRKLCYLKEYLEAWYIFNDLCIVELFHL